MNLCACLRQCGLAPLFVFCLIYFRVGGSQSFFSRYDNMGFGSSKTKSIKASISDYVYRRHAACARWFLDGGEGWEEVDCASDGSRQAEPYGCDCGCRKAEKTDEQGSNTASRPPDAKIWHVRVPRGREWHPKCTHTRWDDFFLMHNPSECARVIRYQCHSDFHRYRLIFKKSPILFLTF